MISWMQKHRKYLVVTIWISTIAFVGAGFVGWGAYSYNQDKANSVATVGNEEITLKELQSAYSNLYNYYNQMLGGQLTKEKAKELRLEDIALNQLIQESLLLNYANENGIIALDEEIVAKLHSIESFQKSGRFDKDRYFQVLKSIGTDARSFERGIEKEIVIEKLNSLLNLPAAPVESKMLFASAFMEDKLKIKTVTVNPEDIKIEDNELKKYWQEHKNSYLSKKSYELEAVTVKSDEIEVDEKSLREYYNEHKGLFKGEDDKILPFEKAKNKVAKKLKKKKAKTKILKKYLAMKNKKTTGQKMVITEGQNGINTQKLHKTPVGSFVKTIELEDGYMTAKLIAINNPQPLEFEKAKESAKTDLLALKLKESLEKKAKEELKSLKDAKVTEFIGKDDADKLDMLDKNEAIRFLNHLFASAQKNGYYLFDKKALVYEITDQKLFNKAKFKEKKEDIQKSAKALKQNHIQQELIKTLQKKYKIEKHFKG